MKIANLTEGPVAPILLKLSAPMLVGIIAMMGFYLIDAYFVGQLGTPQLAALTLTFPVVSIIGCIVIGLGVGAMAIVSRGLGSGDNASIGRYATDALTLGAFCGVLFAAAGIVTIEPLFRMLGADASTLPYVNQYMVVWYAGLVLYIVPMIGSNIVRSTGDTVSPSVLMLASMILNALLDPLLIFGWGPIPRMEMAGAAVAGFVVRLFMTASILVLLRGRSRLLINPFTSLKTLFASWRAILVVGFPVAISNAVFPLVNGVITRLIAGFGAAAVAGFGTAMRIETFGMTLVMALSTGISPFVGQNFGARKFDRIGEGLKVARLVAVGWGLFLTALFFFFREEFAAAVKNDAAVVSVASLYLLLVPISLGLRSVHQLSWTALNVMHLPWHSLMLELLLAVGLWLPLGFLGAHFYGLGGLFAGLAVGNVIGGCVAWFVVDRLLVRETGIEPPVEQLQH